MVAWRRSTAATPRSTGDHTMCLHFCLSCRRTISFVSFRESVTDERIWGWGAVFLQGLDSTRLAVPAILPFFANSDAATTLHVTRRPVAYGPRYYWFRLQVPCQCHFGIHSPLARFRAQQRHRPTRATRKETRASTVYRTLSTWRRPRWQMEPNVQTGPSPRRYGRSTQSTLTSSSWMAGRAKGYGRRRSGSTRHLRFAWSNATG